MPAPHVELFGQGEPVNVVTPPVRVRVLIIVPFTSGPFAFPLQVILMLMIFAEEIVPEEFDNTQVCVGAFVRIVTE
jgi:hypothetical protein